MFVEHNKKKLIIGTNTIAVNFKLDKSISNGAKVVSVVGSFNNWNTYDNQMTEISSAFVLTLDLPRGVHEFKYLTDKGDWINDPNYEISKENRNSIIEVE